MKERPMLMSAPMVRAILAGTKTQTRRVVKPQPGGLLKLALHLARRGLPIWFCDGWDGTCPYGQPGDRLWVREAFDPIFGQSPPDRIIEVDYRADWEPNGKHWRMKDEMGLRRWKPSIHMPRDLSRITLEIVSVRVERLQEITNDDARAEGPEYAHPHRHGTEGLEWEPHPGEIVRDPHADRHNTGWNDCWICAYRQIWNSINGPGSWDANPWVWVVEFKRVTP